MTDKTRHQISRFLDKVAAKFPPTEETVIFTDIHVRVSQDTGDIMAFDDDDREITRCVVEQWINDSQETEVFYDMVVLNIRQLIEQGCYRLGLVEPYNYVLENENGEHVAELFVVDESETAIVGTPFMQGLSKELDDFIDNLLKE